jgi:hypothetical protein
MISTGKQTKPPVIVRFLILEFESSQSNNEINIVIYIEKIQIQKSMLNFISTFNNDIKVNVNVLLTQ